MNWTTLYGRSDWIKKIGEEIKALLDGNYFNSLELKLLKNKYYQASEVDEILVDIRRKAEDQTKELQKLKEEIESLAQKKDEISDAVIAARNAYKTIITKAQKQSGSIVADAEKQAADIIADAQKRAKLLTAKADKLVSEAEEKAKSLIERTDDFQKDKEEYYISKIERMYSKLRENQAEALDNLNGDWQQFLISLSDESESTEEERQKEVNGTDCSAEYTPEEMESVTEKIARIAREIEWMMPDDA